MIYSEAASFIMPFGKHKSKTLDSIASTDEGLKYLDWLRGERQGQVALIDQSLQAYLDDPAIKRELESL